MLLVACVAFVAKANMGEGVKVVLTSGDAKVFAGQKVVNVEYDYSSFGVGKFKTEEEYVNKKVTELNAKEAGKGDKWREGWETSRDTRFAPKFEQLFNDVLTKRDVSVAQNSSDAQYTLIVIVTFIEPGYNIGISKRPAYVDFEFKMVETANRDNVAATFELKNVVGSQAMGYDFDTGSRVAESFAKGGKMLAGFIYKKIK